MRISSLKVMCLATLVATGSAIIGCGGDDNAASVPDAATGGMDSTTTPPGMDSGGTPPPDSSVTPPGTDGGGVTPGTDSGGGGGGTEAGVVAEAGACPSDLSDKVTACTPDSGVTPTCNKGCGPDLPMGAGQLGEKTCSCNPGTLVYNCLDCAYMTPPPVCYSAPTAVTTCPVGASNGAACTTPCTGSASGVCTTVVDSGKTDGCVCILNASMNMVWACATQWW